MSLRQELLSSDTAFLLEVLKGNVPGHTLHHRHGHNGDLGTSLSDIWDDDSVMIYLSSAETMNIVSDNAADDVGSTGALTVNVIGLDANFLEVSEVVNMDGTTNVVTTLAFIRVTDLQVLTVGTGLKNAGKITATATTTSTTPQAVMAVGLNHSLNGKYTSPAGKFGVFVGYEINVGKGFDIITDIFAGSGIGVMSSIHRNHLFEAVLPSSIPDVMVGPKTDIVFRGLSDIASGAIACSFNILEVEEKYIGLS